MSETLNEGFPDEHGHRLSESTKTFGSLEPMKPSNPKDSFLEPPSLGPIRAMKPSNPKDALADKKIPLHLLSPVAKAHWAHAQFIGTVKYGTANYRAVGARASVYISAIERHLDNFTSGETYDPEDGTHHLGNIMACCAILMDTMACGMLTDDRPPSISVRPTYERIMQSMEETKIKYSGLLNIRHYTIEDTKQ